MSTIYNTEPPTKGKVTLKTSLGDLDIELWPKEAPKAVRNFVQLCLEGYYDGAPFHRVINDFMAQGGDPTGTGEGGESVYGAPFKDEFHSRLRFNHRGLVAAANRNAPHTNGSQFFLTLGEAPWLDRVNTIFGRVTGDTVYNLAKFNELEVDEEDRPTHPPVVLGAEVLWNPFEDIRPRTTPEQRRAEAERRREEEAAAAAAARASRRPSKMNRALLSFGGEAEEEEEAAAAAAAPLGGAARVRSAHEAAADARLAPPEETPPEELEWQRRATLQRVKGVLAQRAAGGPPHGERGAGGGVGGGEEADGDRGADKSDAVGGAASAGRGSERGEGREDSGDESGSSGGGDAGEGARSDAGGGGERGGGGVDALLKRRREAVEQLARESRRKAVSRAKGAHEGVPDAGLLHPWQLTRERYKQHKRRIGDRQTDTMQRLAAFQSKLRAAAASAPTSAPAAGAGAGAATSADAAAAPADAAPAAADAAGADAGEGGGAYDGRVRADLDHRAYMPAAWRVDDYLLASDDEDGGDGLHALSTHRLVFEQGVGHGANARRDDVDDYVVVDPLLERAKLKGDPSAKVKFSRSVQAEKKKATAWAGRARG